MLKLGPRETPLQAGWHGRQSGTIFSLRIDTAIIGGT